MAIKIEGDSNLNKPNSWVSKETRVNVTTSISSSIHTLAKERGIAWNDALTFGIIFKLAENDNYEFEYPENNLEKKLKIAMENLKIMSMELNTLKESPKEEPKKDLDDTIDKELKEAGLE